MVHSTLLCHRSRGSHAFCSSSRNLRLTYLAVNLLHTAVDSIIKLLHSSVDSIINNVGCAIVPTQEKNNIFPAPLSHLILIR